MKTSNHKQCPGYNHLRHLLGPRTDAQQARFASIVLDPVGNLRHLGLLRVQRLRGAQELPFSLRRRSRVILSTMCGKRRNTLGNAEKRRPRPLFILNSIVLPRQARDDKHAWGKHSKKRDVFFGARPMPSGRRGFMSCGVVLLSTKRSRMRRMSTSSSTCSRFFKRAKKKKKKEEEKEEESESESEEEESPRERKRVQQGHMTAPRRSSLHARSVRPSL